eukprot:TRINITY_DN7453_c0_g1_i2.p1 TRINITY_DN7453_c0_g1~~TRINITY_DN7453_c0_g1_i2.p1  ORF type:complete len:344 (+),score=74.47 TRINITY_DN7453_c0_g1_i2:3-1034(+)
MNPPQPPYPIHDSVKEKLHPEYILYYNANIIDKQQVHYQPIPVSRGSGILLPGAGPPLSVGRTHDYMIKRVQSPGPDVPIRCFTPPDDQKPPKGWPVLIYYHGGGWVLGNINTENVVCTNICNRVKCVVITVDYRLAPEHPWPAAVHDSWEAVLWVQREGHAILDLDMDKVAVGGSSAGGNLAAIMAHKAAAAAAAEPPMMTSSPFRAQLLMVPVTDNTADPSNNATYREYEFTPALPAVKMHWYRDHYLPNPADRSHPEASPLFYDDDDWSLQPRALIVVGELDVLRQEGELYGKKLSDAGVRVDLHVMKGMPHPFLAMDGVLQAGKDAITYMCNTLTEVFD